MIDRVITHKSSVGCVQVHGMFNITTTSAITAIAFSKWRRHSEDCSRKSAGMLRH